MQKKPLSPSKPIFNPYYPMDRDKIQSRPLTPVKFEQSPNYIYQKNNFLNMNQEEIKDDGNESNKELEYLPEITPPLPRKNKMPPKNGFQINNFEELIDNNPLISSYWDNQTRERQIQSPQEKNQK